MPILKIEKLSKHLGKTAAVSDISFNVPEFQRLAIAGSTGSGKTTLLKMLAGLIQSDSGKIFFNGEKLLGPEEKLMPGHQEIAYLSQHFELRNNYRVEEIIEYSNQLPEQEAQNIFRICRVDHLLKRKSNELSGGEKQRTALARLLITNPSVLLLDEPFSNLDNINKKTIQAVLKDISERLSLTVITVSHDPAEILAWADHILILKNGKLIEQGTPEQVYRYPVTEYAASLLGEYQIISPQLAAGIKLPALKSSENVKWIIRPENIKLSLREIVSLPGTVLRKEFFGSYFMIDVKTGDDILTVFSLVEFVPGMLVNVQIDPKNCCRIIP